VTKVGPLQAFYAAEDYQQLPDAARTSPISSSTTEDREFEEDLCENYIAKPTLVSKAKTTN
jgi:peptide-methionine (S)-S-oxide reductase